MTTAQKLQALRDLLKTWQAKGDTKKPRRRLSEPVPVDEDDVVLWEPEVVPEAHPDK